MAFDIRDEEHPDEFEEYDDVKQPERPKFYRRRKFWYFCIPNTIIAVIVAVILALYVIMPKIAQGLMNKATINFSQIDIANPSPTSMDIAMQGQMEHTGPFHAEISFPGIVVVKWNGIELGTTEIPGTSTASGGHGTLNLQSTFNVTNSTGFTEFSSYMLNAETFVWHLEGRLNVKALGHTVKDLDLSKDITVNAFNGLSGVTIQKFSLPGDDPNGKGILVEIDTMVTNPSAIQMYMGTLTLAISYKNTVMGYVSSSNLTMIRGQQTLSMKGVLIPQTTAEGLADTSEMMSRYIGNIMTDTIATGYEVKPDGVNSLEWLSAAVKDLKLTVPLQSPAPLQLIKSLNLGALGLIFTPPTAYQPITTSTGVLANYTLPDGFGFRIQFTQVANSFALSRNNVTIANLNSSYNPSTSDMTAGTLTFNLLDTPLLVPDASHQTFQEFNRDLTIGADLPFNVVGNASVFANTSIGIVNLVNIPFNASTQLSGLQSLANPAPTITALQVQSGTVTDLTMAITVVIVNPSSISLSAGDVVLDLIYKGTRLGTVTMPNLSIVPGGNTVQASSTINPAASPEGIELLTLYTSGAGAAVSIVGTPTSTAVDSLSLAFGALNIGSQMPGLQSKLLAGASLVVLDTTLVNGIAQTVVTVNNPFVPAMSILSIDSKITYNGVSLGTVVSTFDSPPVIPGTGQGAITASLAMNTNPEDLVTLIRAQAVKNGMNTDAFDGLLSLQHGGNPPSSLFDGFNVADFTIKAMSGLVVDITMSTTVKLGDYQVTIPYTQTGVPTGTDQTILKLIPIVGTPIAQLLVERSALAFDSINILNPGETSFQTDIVGAITDTGPLDAQIAFPNPVTIMYNGKTIGSMTMPTVNAIANKGAALDLKGVQFTIADLAAFTDFNVFAVNNAKFEWTISTTGLVVNAMGVALPGVTMTKTVTLDGFNKLAGLQLADYMINKIDDIGLHMVISASLANPSTIGMTIPTSTFNTAFHGKVLGPAVATGLVLVPHGSSSFVLDATIAAGNGDLTPYLTGIFQNALSGVATELDAQGTGAPGISWLDAAIKSLLLHTSLPPLSAPPIDSVTIDSMSMDFTCESCTWAPTAISSITAKTNLPFTNGAPIVKLSQNVQILDQDGRVVGTLSTPYADAIASGNTVKATTPAAPLTVADGSHEIYEKFIGDLNEATTYQMGLRGTADSILDLGALGKIEVKGIKLDVKTPVDGLQGLKHIAFVGGVGLNYNDQGYQVTNIVNIHNPSKLTLKLGDLSLKVGRNFTAQGYAGKSQIYDLTLSPGDNQVVAQVFLENSSPAGMEIVLAVSNQDVTVVLYAYEQTSKNPALSAGLSRLQSDTIVKQGLPQTSSASPYNLDWSLSAPASVATDGIVEVTGTFNNPFYNSMYHVLQAVGSMDEFPGGSQSLIQLATVGLVDPAAQFDFLQPCPQTNMRFDLKPNSSITLTFKMCVIKLDPSIDLSSFKTVLDSGRDLVGGFAWGPVITLNNDPTRINPSWSTDVVYPALGALGLKFKLSAADFANMVAYAFKPASVLVPSPTTNTTAIVSPTMTPTANITVTVTTTPVFTTTEIPTATVTPEPTVVTTTVATTTDASSEPTPAPTPTPTPTTTTTTTTTIIATTTTTVTTTTDAPSTQPTPDKPPVVPEPPATSAATAP
ncbi:hypothetical protein EDD11_003394 [Mortierella claussenii]|nr:hypothetical protein EDD11_003394 [Mortierella claussenii]